MALVVGSIRVKNPTKNFGFRFSQNEYVYVLHLAFVLQICQDIFFSQSIERINYLLTNIHIEKLGDDRNVEQQ